MPAVKAEVRVRQSKPPIFFENVHGKIRQECVVVAGVDMKRFFTGSHQFMEVSLRTDRQPYLPEIVQSDFSIQSFHYMPRRDAAPDNVRKIRRNVILHGYVDPRVMRRRNQRDTGTDAGSQNGDSFISARL